MLLVVAIFSVTAAVFVPCKWCPQKPPAAKPDSVLWVRLPHRDSLPTSHLSRSTGGGLTRVYSDFEMEFETTGPSCRGLTSVQSLRQEVSRNRDADAAKNVYLCENQLFAGQSWAIEGRCNTQNKIFYLDPCVVPRAKAERKLSFASGCWQRDNIRDVEVGMILATILVGGTPLAMRAKFSATRSAPALLYMQATAVLTWRGKCLPKKIDIIQLQNSLRMLPPSCRKEKAGNSKVVEVCTSGQYFVAGRIRRWEGKDVLWLDQCSFVREAQLLPGKKQIDISFFGEGKPECEFRLDDPEKLLRGAVVSKEILHDGFQSEIPDPVDGVKRKCYFRKEDGVRAKETALCKEEGLGTRNCVVGSEFGRALRATTSFLVANAMGSQVITRSFPVYFKARLISLRKLIGHCSVMVTNDVMFRPTVSLAEKIDVFLVQEKRDDKGEKKYLEFSGATIPARAGDAIVAVSDDGIKGSIVVRELESLPSCKGDTEQQTMGRFQRSGVVARDSTKLVLEPPQVDSWRIDECRMMSLESSAKERQRWAIMRVSSRLDHISVGFLQIMGDLFELQLMDAILGQCDRHIGNWMLRQRPKIGETTVMGIDNDLALGTMRNPWRSREKITSCKLQEPPPFISASTYHRMLSLSTHQLRAFLQKLSSVMGTKNGFSSQEIDATVARLDLVQKYCRSLFERGFVFQEIDFRSSEILGEPTEFWFKNGLVDNPNDSYLGMFQGTAWKYETCLRDCNF